jgi:phosphatidylglycerophosphate synthase
MGKHSPKHSTKYTKTKKYNSKDTETVEDPINRMLKTLAESLCPIFRKLNYTPNGITSLSLIFNIASLYYLIQRNIIAFSICHIIGYFFSVMNGYYAKKYSFVTNFDDKYSYYKDLIYQVLIIFILYDHYQILDFPVVVVVILVLYCMMLMHVGCVEKISSRRKDKKHMSAMANIVPDRCVNHINILKFFGSGVFRIAVIGMVWYLNSKYMENMMDIDNFANLC